LATKRRTLAYGRTLARVDAFVHAVEAARRNQQYATPIINQNQTAARTALHVADDAASPNRPRRNSHKAVAGAFDRAPPLGVSREIVSIGRIVHCLNLGG